MRRPDISLHLVSPKKLREWHPDLEAAIREAFRDAEFTEKGKDVETVLESSLGRHYFPDAERHTLLALRRKGREHPEVAGALFHVPVEGPNPSVKGSEKTGLGWFFTSPRLDRRARRELADDIMDNAHELLRGLGYKRVETTVGTRAGERFLAGRHGYVKRWDRWVKEL